MSQPDDSPSRARIYEPLEGAEVQTFEFDLDGPLTITSVQSEAAYVTPRFPEGIRVSALSKARADVQRETMAYWFLANFSPATGTYFGFAEAGAKDPMDPAGASTIGGLRVGPAPRIGGFDDGEFFDGGRAGDFLPEEFEGHVASEVIVSAVSMFGGLWQRRPPDIAAGATYDKVRASLGTAVDVFETLFRALAPEHGRMGHNGPPGDPVSPVERAIVLRAVADMRMALFSGAEASVLDAIWSGASGVVARLGAWTLGQSNVFFANFTPAAGKAIGVAAPLFAAGVVLWYAGATVSDLIALATKLAK